MRKVIMKRIVLLLCIASLGAFSAQAMDRVAQAAEDDEIILQTADTEFGVLVRHLKLCKTFANVIDVSGVDESIPAPTIASSSWKHIQPLLESVYQLTQIKKRIKKLEQEFEVVHHSGRHCPKTIRESVWKSFKKKYDFEELAAREHQEIWRRLKKEIAQVEREREPHYTAIYTALKDLSQEDVEELIEIEDFCDIRSLMPVLRAFNQSHHDRRLHWACLKGLLEVVKDLVEMKSVNIKAVNKDKETPLIIAARKGHADIVSYLLEKGASSDARCYGYTALAKACEYGHEEVFDVLIAHDPESIKFFADSHFATFMHLAAQGGNLPIVQKIYALQPRADRAIFFQRDASGDTALHKACIGTNEDVVRFILEKFPNHDGGINNVHCTPVHIAAGRGHEGIVQLLVENRAGINVKDCNMSTPLHEACGGGHIKVVRYLTGIEGIWLSEQDNQGRTPLQRARSNKVRKFLMEECELGE